MKLQNTLIYSSILLLLISFNSYAGELDAKSAACNTALSNGDMKSAEKLADDILKQDAKNREGLICKGRLLGVQGNFEVALTTLKEAETLSKEPLEHIIGLMLIGNVYKAQQKFSDAIASYNGSLKIANAEKNEKYIRADFNLIGNVYTQNKDLNAALTNYQAGAKLAMNDNERAESFEFLAATYKALGQFDSAIEFQVKAIQMQKLAGTLDDFAESSLALGQIYVAAKDYANADKTLIKFAQFAKDNGGAYYEAKAKLYLAQSKVARGDVENAKLFLVDARSLANSINAKDLNQEIEQTEKKLSN